jgi:hypothetical protein
MTGIRIIALLLFLNFRMGHCQAVPELLEMKVLSGKASLLIPKTFALMTPETIALKYPMEGHRPTQVYTNDKSTINVALNHTAGNANPSDLSRIKQTMDAQFSKPPFTLISSEMREINGKKYGVFEFESQAVDTKIYNLMAIGILENRLLMITFNCTVDNKPQWTAVGKKIVGSITTAK